MNRIDAPFAAISLLCIVLVFTLLWRSEDSPGKLTARCDSHRSLIYREGGDVIRIVEFHPDCRP